jgi:hypothetical protein
MSDAALAPVGKFTYPPHPIAEIFPILDPASLEFSALMEDIKENDLREPIMLYEDKVLDGRNRYLEHVPPKLNRWGSMGFTGRSG